MKSASPWISGSGGTWDNQQRLDLDANGWVRSLAPGQIARTLMLRSIPNLYPAGRYLVRYKGQGTLKVEFAARIVSQTPGEIVIDVNPAIDGGVYLGIEATNPSDYVREIVVTMPGGICEGDPFTQVASAQTCGTRRFLSFADNSDSIIFNPVFLNRLRAYSALRFMDWMSTNNAGITNWSARTPVSYQTWAGTVPIEVMIELCNRLGAHPWFTVWHLIDDASVNAFAQTVKSRLNQALRVYVEH